MVEGKQKYSVLFSSILIFSVAAAETFPGVATGRVRGGGGRAGG
jgi:hypothetical protein